MFAAGDGAELVMTQCHSPTHAWFGWTPGADRRSRSANL